MFRPIAPYLLSRRAIAIRWLQGRDTGEKVGMQFQKGIFNTLSKMPKFDIDFLVKNDIPLMIEGVKKVKGFRQGHGLKFGFIMLARQGMQFNQYLTQIYVRRKKGRKGGPFAA